VARRGSVEQLRFLLDRGSRLKDTTDWNSTALFLAAQRNGDKATAVVQELLARGAKSVIEDQDFGETRRASDWALRAGNVDAFKLLVVHSVGARAVHSILREAVYIDFKKKKRSFEIPLHPLRVELGCNAMITVGRFRDLLRSLDAVLFQSRDDDGALPIHIACSLGADVETLQLIVEKGGVETLHARDHNGDLPLHRLLCANLNLEPDAVEYLVTAHQESVRLVTHPGLLSIC